VIAIKYFKKFKKTRKITMSPNEMINFETSIAADYEKGKINGPIHLSRGNEEELIDIFSRIAKNDWVFSSWRNHYHALLHGVSPSLIKKFIYSGKSMSVSSKKPKFFSSSIVGGIISIALGASLALKKNRSKNKVFCFVGDMTAETGFFYECYKYSQQKQLPLIFVIEDNNLSTNTPTDKTWGRKKLDLKLFKNVIWYKYKNTYPHHGTGKWVLF
jgi:TPP-dependent pyruvate/acetoin dehydrogenase alpha subunit